MTGILLYIMGPSGVGKDSLIAHARRAVVEPYAGTWDATAVSRENMRTVRFIRRYVTRPAAAGGEEHRPIGREEFAAMRDGNEFAMSWESHGLGYGIGTEVDAFLNAGDLVLLNGSRAYLPEALGRYPNLVPLLITARPEVLRARLEGRGRETGGALEERIRGASMDLPDVPGMITVDNSGDIEKTRSRLLGIIEGLRRAA